MAAQQVVYTSGEDDMRGAAAFQNNPRQTYYATASVTLGLETYKANIDRCASIEKAEGAVKVELAKVVREAAIKDLAEKAKHLAGWIIGAAENINPKERLIPYGEFYQRYAKLDLDYNTEVMTTSIADLAKLLDIYHEALALIDELGVDAATTVVGG